jgi:hypothetical protein
VKPRPALPFWTTCIVAAIHDVKEVVPFFRQRQIHFSGLRMCRLATLYLTGGYYFTVDFELKSDLASRQRVSASRAMVIICH